MQDLSNVQVGDKLVRIGRYGDIQAILNISDVVVVLLPERSSQ